MNKTFVTIENALGGSLSHQGKRKRQISTKELPNHHVRHCSFDCCGDRQIQRSNPHKLHHVDMTAMAQDKEAVLPLHLDVPAKWNVNQYYYHRPTTPPNKGRNFKSFCKNVHQLPNCLRDVAHEAEIIMFCRNTSRNEPRIKIPIEAPTGPIVKIRRRHSHNKSSQVLGPKTPPYKFATRPSDPESPIL